MNWQSIVAIILLAFLFAFWFYISNRDATNLHNQLRAFRARAESTRDRDQLIRLNRELIAFAKAACWNRGYSAHAHEINQYIVGKIDALHQV